MSTNQVSNKVALTKTAPKIADLIRPPDASATQAMKELAKGNTKAGSISGQEMADAIIKATKDTDGQAAGKEFAVISKFVEKNGKLLSPEAKKVYEVYAKAAKKAQSEGQTGIDFRSYQSMQRDMRSVASPQYKDKGAGAALNELAKGNTKPGSISGQEMTDTILKATKDLDGQAAGKEFKDIEKFAKENEHLLSPEAKKAFDIYKKTAKESQAKGQTGIPTDKYNRMARDMMRVSNPNYTDKSAATQLNALAKDNKAPGSISGEEMANAIINGTKDLDNQAAGKEFKDISKFVRENEHLLSPEAKAAYATYEKAAKAAQAKGQTGIDTKTFAKLEKDIRAAGAPKYQDKSMGSALNELKAQNGKPGSISATDLANAMNKGAGDLDNQAAGKEFKDLQKFVNENKQLLSPEAQKAYAEYEKAANAANKNGQSGIPQKDFDALISKMKGFDPKPPAPAPVGGDASATAALDALKKNNGQPGSISGQEMTDAIIAGTKDLDNQAAGKEFVDIEKFVKDNSALLSPEAKAAYEVYAKTAKAAQAKGQTGIDTNTYNKMEAQMREVSTPKYGDSSMGGALNELAKNNTKPGSISATDLANAVNKGAGDLDNQAAGKEFADLQKFAKENAHLLSPEAKKALAEYEKVATAAQGKGQTGIPQGEFNSLVDRMKTFDGGDKGATAALEGLKAANGQPGSISGKEMTDAIIAGTKDLDNQAAGREFADIEKFVQQNGALLSPEAKAAYEVYAKTAKAAQAKGQTGIETGTYNKMEAEMRKVSTPKYGDSSMGGAIADLAKNNTKPGSISATDLANAVSKGAGDLDNQAAGKEFQDLKKFVTENQHLLSPEAKKAFAEYEKAAAAANKNGQTGIPQKEFDSLVSKMKGFDPKPKPVGGDASATAALKELKAANGQPGSISGQEMTDAIIKGTKDLDNQAAGKEFADIEKFVKDNGALLSPEAKAAYEVYAKTAKAAQAKGQTGIDTKTFDKMEAQMREVSKPKYGDSSMGSAINDLAKGNTKPGSISGKELADAVAKGAGDLDNQAAGKEFQDLKKFVTENQHLLSPEAKKAFAEYEKVANAAQAKGQTGIPQAEFDKLLSKMRGEVPQH